MVRQERILLVEDDEDITEWLSLEFAHEGYELIAVNDGRAGLEQAQSADWDMILLDVMLPGMSGLELCRRIRADSHVPIIMLTARGTVPDRIAGLDYGADDYLVKPFAVEELFARMRGVLRRVSYRQETVLGAKDLEMNVNTREVLRGGEAVSLTTREFALLQYLLEHRNQVMSRESILQSVWGYDFMGDTNVVDVYIRYVRAKVDQGREPLVHTVRGVGYVLRDK
ncbi:MAG: response regulator transcription factor [Bacilli bacterium]